MLLVDQDGLAENCMLVLLTQSMSKLSLCSFGLIFTLSIATAVECCLVAAKQPKDTSYTFIFRKQMKQLTEAPIRCTSSRQMTSIKRRHLIPNARCPLRFLTVHTLTSHMKSMLGLGKLVRILSTTGAACLICFRWAQLGICYRKFVK